MRKMVQYSGFDLFCSGYYRRSNRRHKRKSSKWLRQLAKAEIRRIG